MYQLIDRFCRWLDGLMAAGLAVMVLLVFGNVVLRYVFNSGITVSEELSRWAFVWITFLGALVALKDKGHLGTDIVVALLPRLGQQACLIVSRALMLVLCGGILQGSWQQLRINWDVQAPVTGLSMGWFYAPGVVFAVCGAVLLALELVRILRGVLADSPAETVAAAASALDTTVHTAETPEANRIVPTCRRAKGARQ